MTRRYSGLSHLREGLRGHSGWRPAWRTPEPRPEYDAIVIGGGGHGLATAYYLAANHGMTNVAVIEKGWIGGGNTGRNTTVVRSNYFHPESVALYDFALRLYEGLSRELNYNIMLSQRGMAIVAHSEAEMEIAARIVNAMQINGADAELLSARQVLDRIPLLNTSDRARYPVADAAWQGRAGVARHDAVAWGYARAADARGVDIIQNREVTGIERPIVFPDNDRPGVMSAEAGLAYLRLHGLLVGERIVVATCNDPAYGAEAALAAADARIIVADLRDEAAAAVDGIEVLRGATVTACTGPGGRGGEDRRSTH